jgi:hypothetical protein
VQALRSLDGQLVSAEDSAAVRPPEKLSVLAKRVGLPAAEIRKLAGVGAIEASVRGGTQWLDGRSVAIVEEWAAIRRAGFTDDLGFGPEDAKLYVEMVQWLARQELRIFSRGVTGKVSSDLARSMAQRGIDGLGRILTLLREATLLRYIAEGNVPDDAADPRTDKAMGE